MQSFQTLKERIVSNKVMGTEDAMTTTSTIRKSHYPIELPDAFYDDPETVEDSMVQRLPLDLIRHQLREAFEDRADVYVSGEAFVFYDRNDPYRRISPDCFITFDVDAERVLEEFPNYLVWGVGKFPDFVLEMASPSTARNDLGHKRDLYARLGIAEYWLLDPEDGKWYGRRIVGLRLVDGEYREYPIYEAPDGSITVHSELLNLDFHWSDGEFVILDPDTGLPIDRRAAAERRAEEERAARLAEATRADAAEARAGEEATRADAAERRERELLQEIARLRGQSGQ